MNGLELILRTAKRYYEEKFLQGPNQLYRMLFPMDDESTAASFLLDKLVQTPYAIAYRNKDTQSHVRPYEPGSGQLFTIPVGSEKTALSEELLDSIAVGIEAVGGFSQNEAKMLMDIMSDHLSGHNMLKNKQALEVFETGKFRARGPGGVDLGLDINFKRDSSLSLSYDFTAAGGSFSEAIAEQQEELRGKGVSISNMAVILGQDWLSEYQKDEDAQKAAQNNAANQLVVNQMTPELLRGTQGLYVFGQIRTRKMLAPVWLLSYSPGVLYKTSRGDSGSEFMDKGKSLMFSLDEPRYNVKRGMKAFNEAGSVQRVVGDMVTDSYTEKDPVATYIRSMTRHAFIPGNINHTSVSTGTFE